MSLNPKSASTYHFRLCTELAGLFPDHGADQIALAVSQSELNIDRACDYLLEGGSAVPESQSSTFDLLPDVLNAWNEKIDLDELDVGFDEFIAENHHQHYQPVTIRDSNLFSQLVSRFGQPRVNYRPSNDDYATIPGELAKQIFDWWCITMETETDDDAKMAQELADQEMAREMQEQDELKETTRRLASNQIKQRKKSNGENQEDEFPELNPNGPIHHVPHARTRGGQWISKTSLGHRDKIQKMSRLFPELPETRLEEYLRISRGNVSEATKLICALTDKNERDINQHRAKISRTKNIALSAPPAVTTTADCLGDNVETSAAEWTYDQMRSESVDLFRQGTLTLLNVQLNASSKPNASNKKRASMPSVMRVTRLSIMRTRHHSCASGQWRHRRVPPNTFSPETTPSTVAMGSLICMGFILMRD